MINSLKIAIHFPDDSFRTEVTEPPSGGVTAGTMGWHRVVDALRDFGAIRDNERVTYIVAHANGLDIWVEQKRKPKYPEYVSVKKGEPKS